MRILQYDVTPDLLVTALSTHNVSISPSVSVMHIRRKRKLHLRGVVYFRDSHFTARVVKLDGSVLFYDGRELEREALGEGKSSEFSDDDWDHRKGAVAVMAVYSR